MGATPAFFADLPQPIEGRADYRVLITAGLWWPRWR